MTRVRLILGAGGVGKTTIAAALGALAARRGEKTLVMTVDPAKRLADALGTGLGHEPAAVPGSNSLYAAMLDARAAWESIVVATADEGTGQRLLGNPFFRAIADRFPAGLSYAAADHLASQVESGRYQFVVVDTPPGQAGREFLAAPERIRRLVAAKALRLLTASRVPGSRFLFRITTRPAVRVMDAVLGGRLMRDLADFLLDLSSIYPAIVRRSKRVEAVLRKASATVVATADLGPALTARKLLHAEGGPVADSIVFNRTLPERWAHSEGGIDPIGRSLRQWGAEARRQAAVRGDPVFGGVALFTVPLLPVAPSDPGALADLAESAGIVA